MHIAKAEDEEEARAARRARKADRLRKYEEKARKLKKSLSKDGPEAFEEGDGGLLMYELKGSNI